MARQGGKGKKAGNRAHGNGPWRGGPQKSGPKRGASQPSSPRQTRDRAGTPPPRDFEGAGAPPDANSGGRSGSGGFARPGRSQPGRPGPIERANRDERPPRDERPAYREVGEPRGGERSGPRQKPWANRPAVERRAERTRLSEDRENNARAATPLAPRRSDRSELRPPRELPAVRSGALPRSPAPLGPTPLERRRAYRYGGEVAVDRDVLYGRNAVAEALRAGRRKVRTLLLAEGTEDRKAAADLAALAVARGVEVRHIARVEIERRAPGVNHQGAVLEVGPYPYADFEDMLAAIRDNDHAILLVLDSLQDPQNLGTLIRTAEAAGVTGIVIPEHRAVQVSPAVVNASAGAVEHLPVVSVPNLVRAVERAKEAGAWAIAAEAVPEAMLPSDADLTGPVVLVVGSEGVGVGRLLRETCDLIVRIPLVGKVGSLNAATAGSILLYEIVRQRTEAVALAALTATNE